MGSVTYEFLNESFLFDISLIDESFASVSENDLIKELEKYRDYTISSLPILREEIKDKERLLRIFGAKDYFSIDHLVQTAFYLDQVVLPDPLLPFSRNETDVSKAMSEFLGMKRNNLVDRQKLTLAVRKMKLLTPMVAGNYVKFFPVSYYLEPDDHIPISYSKNAFSDVLPSQILSSYREKAEVKSLKKNEDGWVVENCLNVGRGIAIQFSGDDDNNIRLYNLFEQEIVKLDEETRTAHFKMNLPEEPPTVDYFNVWVNQSINQASIAHYQELLKGFFLSSSLGASFLTTSPFTHSLLGTNASGKTIQGHTSELVLNMNLPFLTNVSMDDLMNIRENDGEAFDLFRRELESKFKAFRTTEDTELIRIGIEDAVHELAEVQVAKINQKIKELRKGALAQAVIAAGGLAGSVVTSGASLAATAIAVANGYKSYSEYREKVRENPAYFLWKVRNT